MKKEKTSVIFIVGKLKRFIYGVILFCVTKFIKSYESYSNLKIKFGFIHSDGQPLECGYCGCKEFKSTHEDYIEHMLCEYNEVCIKCGEIAGFWGYGSWQV